jgi:diaminopropionate ammonia-lyase family
MDSVEQCREVCMPFSMDEYADRFEKVKRRMDEESIDLLVSSKPENIYYLTNYQTVGDPFQVMLIDRNYGIHIITRELESTNVKYRSMVEYSYYTESQSPVYVVAKYIFKKYEIAKIGFEYNSKRVTYLDQTQLEKHLTELFDPSKIDFKDASTLISEIRMIKSEAEIKYMKRAANMAEQGIDEGIRDLEVGMTETHIAGTITKKMCEMGCEYTAYPPFVAAGWSGCMGHYTARQKELVDGDILFLEIGGCCERYHATRMHTVYIGEQPEWFKEAEDILRRAVDTARSSMIPGVPARDIDLVARTIISEYRYDHIQSERSGYSIGIGFYTDWAENDVLQIHPRTDAILEENMVIHFIPWIQIPNQGAIGFSDTIVVTKEGGVSLFEFPNSSTYHNLVRYVEPKSDRVIGTKTDSIMTDINSHINEAIIYHREDSYDPTRLVTRKFDGINRLYVKDEYGRKGLMAFKIMGVEYAVHRLEEAGKLHPGSVITTMTDGNHGAAVAHVAKAHNLKAVIFVPKNMTRERIERIEEYGSDIECRVVDGMYDDAIDIVKTQADKNGWILISDTAWGGYEDIPKDIATGYCAIFDEAVNQIDEKMGKGGYPTHIFLQAGVGGFPSAGVAYAILRMSPKPKLICVEPDDADCILENIKENCQEGTMMCSGKTNSIMSGLNCGLPSTTAWPILRDYVDMYVAIGDAWARKAVRALHHHPKRIMAGESGAAGVAGLMACLNSPELKEKVGLNENSNVLVINTEGVTDKASFNRIVGYQVFN